ncbi:MAG: discoidin domain-containing protein [Verrucomicrobiota bacterium]|jgi:hypothetical protein
MTRPLLLKARNRKPAALGPEVPVEAVRANPAADEAGLRAIINGAGLADTDHDGLKEHSVNRSDMWLGQWRTNLCLQFEFSNAVPLAAIEVWNFNAEWQTTNGLRKADIAVSSDGTNWQSVLRGAEFAEAEGTDDYDTPTVLRLNGVVAQKVRFENLMPWSNSGNVGLSEVVFHRAAHQNEASSKQGMPTH